MVVVGAGVVEANVVVIAVVVGAGVVVVGAGVVVVGSAVVVGPSVVATMYELVIVTAGVVVHS